MKTYLVSKGATTGLVVEADGLHGILKPRFDLRNHSPDGFSYGYGGSGPSQLALAILCDVTGDDALAQSKYQQFKWDMIAPYPQDEDFKMTDEAVNNWLGLVGK